MRIEELIGSLAEAQGFAGPADESAIRIFAEACDRADTDAREDRRIRAIADQIDAEDLIYAQAIAALDRGDRNAAASALRRCAIAGIGESAWLLGALVQEAGKAAEAVQWYEHAANDGDIRAEAKLAELRVVPGAVKDPTPFDERDLDAVLSGETGDIPTALLPVADCLAALTTASAAADLGGETAAMAEFRALGLGQTERPAGPAPTILLEALPDGQQGRKPARHRVRRAALRPAMLSAFAVGAVIVLAVLVMGNFAAPFRDISHMASPSAGTRSSAATAGHSAAPRVETTSAGLEPTTNPPVTHPTASAQPTPSKICRAYYTDIKHPGLSAWATQQSLWEQVAKLAGSDNWLKVYRYCAPYVGDLFPNGAPGNTLTPPNGTGDGAATPALSPGN